MRWSLKNGLSIVINSAIGTTKIFQFADNKFDISEMVLNKLGVRMNPSEWIIPSTLLINLLDLSLVSA